MIASQSLTFIDFCAGIGGGRLGLEKNGMRCLGFSEIDKQAEQTYRVLFGNKEVNFGDLTKINPLKLPNFDFLIAGFPCQTFSIIGQRKGMDDERGQIIFHLANILKQKAVKFFLLENVKGLINHNSGNSLATIVQTLEKAGYVIRWQVLNSLNYGVPQSRERVYLVGFKKDLILNNLDFQFPNSQEQTNKLDDFLIDTNELTFNEKQLAYNTFLKYLNNKYNENKYSVAKLLQNEFLVLDTRQSDLRLYYNKIPTLRTGRHGILYVKNNKFRKLSGFEALLLQGFPKDLAIQAKTKISDINLLKQAGNAMTATTIEAVVKKMLESIKKYNLCKI